MPDEANVENGTLAYTMYKTKIGEAKWSAWFWNTIVVCHYLQAFLQLLSQPAAHHHTGWINLCSTIVFAHNGSRPISSGTIMLIVFNPQAALSIYLLISKQRQIPTYKCTLLSLNESPSTKAVSPILSVSFISFLTIKESMLYPRVVSYLVFYI